MPESSLTSKHECFLLGGHAHLKFPVSIDSLWLAGASVKYGRYRLRATHDAYLC